MLPIWENRAARALLDLEHQPLESQAGTWGWSELENREAEDSWDNRHSSPRAEPGTGL